MSEALLASRTVLVTGASSGIGRSCALALGKAGAQVVANYHSDRQGAGETVAAIEAGGGRAFSHQANVGREEEVRSMFARAISTFGSLDVLISNAGIQKDADFIDMTLDSWQAVIDTNLTGAFLCAREAARIFCGRAAAGEVAVDEDAPVNGNIIFMSSVHDAIPWAGHGNYCAAKGGLSMLMKTFAQELGPNKVRVNAVAPGAIMTDINRSAWQNEESRKSLLKKIPYGRLGKPEDVARAVVWLACDDSDYVHGHTLYIDGGMMLFPGFREGG